MNGRTIVVTGASSGIGRAVAVRALAGGFDVLGVGRRGEMLTELARSQRDARGSLETLALDLMEPGAPARIVGASLRRFGRIDVIVNAAGAVAVGPIVQQSDAALREQFIVHVIAPLALVREALPALSATRGQVFFVGSGVARVPVGGMGAYPSAKAAVRNAARIARMDLRAAGIAVTYVDPGAVDTDFMRRAGFVGAPRRLALSPNIVAGKLLRAIEKRQRLVTASPWQTALVALAELFPRASDAVVSRFPVIVGSERRQPKPKEPARSQHGADAASRTASSPPDASAASGAPPSSTFDAALEPLARRMERLKLPRSFVAGLLQPGTVLASDDVALRWAGMPNKNERALVHDVLTALEGAGLLAAAGEDRYRVLRSAEE